jgi:hypothetical protein
MKYIIKQTREIIEGYITEIFEIEAETEKEALLLIDNSKVNSIDCDINIEQSEFMYNKIK